MILLTCLIAIFRIITPKPLERLPFFFTKNLMALRQLLQNTQVLSETWYARYKAQCFKHKQLDEEVKKAFVESVKHRYSDWMFCIRNPNFQKYKKKEDRYKNGPSFIPTPFWKEMVDKMDGGRLGGEYKWNTCHKFSHSLSNHYLLIFS